MTSLPLERNLRLRHPSAAAAGVPNNHLCKSALHKASLW